MKRYTPLASQLASRPQHYTDQEQRSAKIWAEASPYSSAKITHLPCCDPTNNNPRHKSYTYKNLARASATHGHSKRHHSASHLYIDGHHNVVQVEQVCEIKVEWIVVVVKSYQHHRVNTHRPCRWYKPKSTRTHHHERERRNVLAVLMIDGSVVGGGHHGNTW